VWEVNLGLMKLIFGKNLDKSEAGEDLLIRGSHRYYNPDDLVGRKGLDVYSSMCKDAQVKACLSIKKASVLSRGWEIIPVKADGERGKEVAEFCSWALEEMNGSILTLLWNVCDAIAKGYSIQNFVWQVIKTGKWAGKWSPLFLKSKDPGDWSFDVDEYKNITCLRHHLDDKTFDVSRFVVYSYNPEYSNPYGVSDLRACYRNWWSKDLLTRFWNLYLEKYGSPTVKGSYRRGTPKAAQAELLNILSKIQQQSAVVIPEDMKAELLETVRQGDVGYRIAVDYHNKEIAKSILNMTLITDDGSHVGSFALAKVHLDILRMCLKGLKLDLEESVMKEQVLRPMVRYNFGVDVPVPDFSLGPMEERELAPLSTGIKNLVDCGVLDPKDPFIREFLGLQGAGPAPDKPEVATVTRTRVGTGPNDGNDGNVRVGT
jgi:phage gp29-like protein